MLSCDIIERHLVRLYQIAQSNLARLNPGCHGDGVQHDLERKADAGVGNAAIRPDRAFVGCDREGPAMNGRHPVGARQDARDLRGFEASRERIGRVSAGIDGRFAIDSAQPAGVIGVDMVGVQSGVTTLVDQGGAPCMTLPGGWRCR